jgi:hypothetical protein
MVIVGVLALLPLLASTARAGRTRFGWLYDVETVPQRSVEIETWIYEKDGKGSPEIDETWLWWGPVIGVTDRVELAIPIEFAHKRTAESAGTGLERVGAEVRWRLTHPDPVESGPFAALVRLGIRRLVNERSAVRFDPNLVLGLDLGRVHLGADLGGVLKVSDDDVVIEARPGGGVSVLVAGELRLGAEVYAEIGLGDSPAVDWVALGPNLAWTHGRAWISASFPIGLSNLDAAPRLNFAIAF